MLEDLKPTSRIRTCKVRTLCEDLSESDQRILLDAVNDAETWSINALVVALRDRGLTITRDTIDRHRRRVCSCSRT